MKSELIRLLCEKSFRFTETPTFRLASGRMSRYYVNCKPVTLSPRGMYLVGHLVFEAVRDLDISGIGGLTFGADPIAMATAFVSGLKKKPMSAFSIRKIRKDHGIVKWIEGELPENAPVAIVEDVVTTGGSTIKAVERARTERLQVKRVVVLVDRQEGGMEEIQKYVDDVRAVIGRNEMMRVYRELTPSRQL